jgi:undecaprenyl-diphosphatase
LTIETRIVKSKPKIRAARILLWLAAGLFITAIVVQIPNESSNEGGLQKLDLMVLRTVAEWRSSWLTIMFTNLTALGSTTLVMLHSAIALALLISTRDKNGALQLALASAGAQGLTEITKSILERPRPTAIPALVEAFGFSFPSGHALSAAAMYVTIALLACRHLQLKAQRILVGICTAVVLFSVALSRVYLGVHYPTDVISGVVVGTAWAFLLAGVFSAIESR